MLWYSWINPNIHHLGVKSRVLYSGADLVATHDSKAGEWWWLCMMNSNLKLAKPFIILTMRHREGWDSLKCPNHTKLTQSWYEKWASAKPSLTPPPLLKNTLWCPFWTSYSNLNHLQPFIILIVRCWKGWDAVIFLNQSKHTPSWCEK